MTLRRRLGHYFRADIYRRLLRYARPYRRAMLLVIALTQALAGLALLNPWPMKILVDSGLGHHRLPHWLTSRFPFLASGGRSVIVFAVGAVLAVRLVSAGIGLLNNYVKQKVNDGLTVDFKVDLFDHLQRLSLTYHDRTTVADSMYRVNTDAEFLGTLIWGNFRHLVTSLLTLVGILWIVLRLDWQLAVMSLLAAPLLYAAAGASGRRFRGESKKVKGMESAAQAVVHEVLSCLRVVRAFGQEDRELARYRQRSRAALLAKMRLYLLQNVFSSGLSLMAKLVRAAILLVGGLHALEGRITIGELLVVLAYVEQIHSPLEDIGNALLDMQFSLAGAERTLDVLALSTEVQDRPGATQPGAVRGAVIFEGVSFAYPDGGPVLFDIDFSAHPGDVVAIVGPTGAGKTTIVSLIARFYDVDRGRILLDGHDLRDIRLRSLRESIAVVIQEPILFAGTIRENIAYGRPHAGAGEIETAARAANAHDFVSALPDGYETEIGERGVRLSGGERQRIAIARAFLKDAPILILDEPTASVDSRTEIVILDALQRLMLDRTTFVIAHRLSTVRRADQILVIDGGRLVEAGTHEQLLNRGGCYAELHHLQVEGLRSVTGDQEIDLTEVGDAAPARGPASGSPRPEQVLEDGLVAHFGRPVHISDLEWQQMSRMSTHPISRLLVTLDDGQKLPVIFKRVNPRLAPQGDYEGRIYESLLGNGRFGAPTLYAHHSDQERGCHWLFLEDVGPSMLRHAGAEAWRAAFRRLGEVHGSWHGRAAELRALGLLPEHHAGHFEDIVSAAQRNLQLTASAKTLERLERLGTRFAPTIARLAAQPRTLVHGDVFQENIMIQPGPTARIIDWERAAIGLGAWELVRLLDGWGAHKWEFTKEYLAELARHASGTLDLWEFEVTLRQCEQLKPIWHLSLAEEDCQDPTFVRERLDRFQHNLLWTGGRRSPR